MLSFILGSKLESVLFTDQYYSRKIKYRSFHSCRSLQSIIIHKSVIEIGESVFGKCSRLQSVIFAEHLSIQTINIHPNNQQRYILYKQTSLQFINIPTTVTTINLVTLATLLGALFCRSLIFKLTKLLSIIVLSMTCCHYICM